MLAMTIHSYFSHTKKHHNITQTTIALEIPTKSEATIFRNNEQERLIKASSKD